MFFQWFVGQNPFQDLRKTRPIILNRSQPPSTIPKPFYIDFTSLIFFWNMNVFFEKICSIFWSIFKVFPIFSLFLELWRLWDHSQIVDLIFLNRMVSTRASESSKTPHSWQNNVPKRSTSWLVVCKPPASWLVVCKQPTIFLCLDSAYFFAIHFGHCFVRNEEFWRIQKLSSIPSWSEKWDLQFGSGPRASGAQEIRKI